MGRTPHPPAVIREAVRLNKEDGQNTRQIAEKLGVHHATVARWLKEPERYIRESTPTETPAGKDAAGDSTPRAKPEPRAVPPAGNDGPAMELEYTPPPNLGEEDPYRCGNCQEVLDADERPRWCPGCEARLEWP